MSGKPGARFWTPERLHMIEDGIEAGLSDATIGARLGCTGAAVNIARKRHGIKSRHAAMMTARSVADLMGLSCSKAVTRWIKAGHLKAKRGQRYGPYRVWIVSEDALQQFLENPALWHLWKPERFTNKDWREWALEVRTERFLSTGEVGKRLGVGSQAVNDWIHGGIIPAVRHGNWYVRESSLIGFVPPCERQQRHEHVRRFNSTEDGWLRVWAAEGWTYQAMANALGRSISSIHGRIGRLGMTQERLL